MLRIKILGIGCARHKKLKANLSEAIRRYPVQANIREVSEVNDLIRYGISSTPALVINNEVKFENEVPTVDQLVQIFKELQPTITQQEHSNTILVPIDFSDASTNAFHYAMDLAPYFDANVKVLHIYHPDFDLSNPYIPEPEAGFLEAREKQLNIFLEQNTEQHQSGENGIIVQPAVEGVLIPGFAATELPNIIKKEKPVMVVMGTTGSNNLGSQLFGSVSKDVSQNSDYPVLMVPGGNAFKGIKKILYASNYYMDDEILINRVMEIGKKFQAEFHIVHVEQKLNGYVFSDEDFKKIFEKHGGKCNYKFKTIKDQQVAETLSRYVQEEGIDMVVMLTQNRSFWQNLLHRSVTRRMALITSVPIMIIHMDM
ncbi:MAG: universal stress protein [Saprospiraceae bacterium]|nr:universal stress protein [Saprospiraceae bacterium]